MYGGLGVRDFSTSSLKVIGPETGGSTCWVTPDKQTTVNDILSQDLVEYQTYVYFSESSQ